jgi:Tfp pilus assembly protein FimT
MKSTVAAPGIGTSRGAGNTSAIFLQQSAGFSLVELSIVMLFTLALAGFAALNITGILPAINANHSMSQVVDQLRNARELAVAQRRNIEVLFQNGNEIQLVRNDVPGGTTDMGMSTLEHGFEFCLFDEIPDTPDSFGNSEAIDFNGAGSMTFLSDGTLVDEAGNPLTGSVFLGVEDHPETARAVTILGATGRIRSYRWNGTSWIQ